MTYSRRKFLMLSGGGVILAATGATAAFIGTRTPEDALKPWRTAGSIYQEPRKRALSYAILAPNPHNRQPWIADLSIPDEVWLYVDTGRLLPHTDPYNRQITIGLGCFLELMEQAAADQGYRIDLELFPEGQDSYQLDSRPIAIACFVKSARVVTDPLFRHVVNRRSVKQPYDMKKSVGDETLRKLRDAATAGVRAGSTNDPASVASLRQLTWDAHLVESTTPYTYQESVDLMRFGKKEIETNPDGLALGGAFLETLMLAGILDREQVGTVGSTAYKKGLEMYREMLYSAQGHIWLITDTNTREDQISAGRSWVRVNLAATSVDLGIHPLSQALQEYPEMNRLYAEIHKRLAPAGGTIQMLARLGYSESVPPSPRWSLEHKIING